MPDVNIFPSTEIQFFLQVWVDYVTSLLRTSLLSFEQTIFGLNFWPRDFAADKATDDSRQLVDLNKTKANINRTRA